MINFFLEDSAQEAFIPPLFERLIVEEGFSVDDFQFKILCSRGGGCSGNHTTCKVRKEPL